MPHSDYDTFLGKLESGLVSPSEPLPAGRVVLHQDGTASKNPHLTPPAAKQFTGTADVDGLFNDSPSYQSYKKEKFEHRLMLWYRLQGHSVKETAALTGYTPQSVSQVCKQPWFREAFCRLAKEAGQDALRTAIEGEALPAFQRLCDIAETSQNENVKLAANNAILDRFLGKPTQKTESTVKGSVDTVIYDAAKLMEENTRIQKELAARGIGNQHGHGTN